MMYFPQTRSQQTPHLSSISEAIEMRGLDQTDQEEHEQPSESAIIRFRRALNPFNWNRRRVCSMLQGACFGVFLGSMYLCYVDPLVCETYKGNSSQFLSQVTSLNKLVSLFKDIKNGTQVLDLDYFHDASCLQRVKDATIYDAIFTQGVRNMYTNPGHIVSVERVPDPCAHTIKFASENFVNFVKSRDEALEECYSFEDMLLKTFITPVIEMLPLLTK